MAFADRKSNTSRGSSGKSSSRDEAPARSSSFKKKPASNQGQSDWINLGSITANKKLLDSDDMYGDICEALDGSEYSFNLKIWTGDDDKTITLRNGDYVTLKFKRGPKDKDFVLGKASLAVND